MRILSRTRRPSRDALVRSGALSGALALALLAPEVASAAPGLRQGPEQRREPGTVIAAAESAILAGRPWLATELLDSLLRDPGTRTPRTVLATARAAAGWRGWSRVERLLQGATWLDSLDGEGHALLARAALESGRTNAALDHARRSVVGTVGSSSGSRFVTLGRAWDRLDQRDSAAVAYRRAADLIPELRDWLTLRAAGVTDSARDRATLLGTVSLPAARLRIRWTEALGRDRAGHPLEAARLYDSLGDRLTAFRLRLDGTPPDARAGLRAELIQALASLDASQARDAISLVDRELAPLTPTEQLIVARRAVVVGPPERTVIGFRAADRQGLLHEEDRFRYAIALVSAGQYQEAIRQFARVTGKEWGGRAAYQSARTRMVMGRTDLAIPALRAVAETHQGDPEAAGTALFLLGDLLTDRGKDSAARATFLELGGRHPTNRFAATARLRAALTAFRAGVPRQAAAELDLLRVGGPEAAAASYWAGRAWLAAGDTTTAKARWHSALSSGDEYYTLLAAQSLGLPGWTAPTGQRSTSALPGLAAALSRVDLLIDLGMPVEAGQEYDWINTEARRSTRLLVGAARTLDSAGRPHRAVRFAIRAQGQGAGADNLLARLLYPLPHAETVVAEAGRNAIDPLLVASIIRQESAFDPDATSRAGARGLMQVMPAVGVAEARTIPIEDFDPVLLYQPEVNLLLGTRQLAETLRKYRTMEQALAAYNAGGSRVTRWLQTPGVADDGTLFVERIPLTETRDYVRRIVVALARYRVLYPSP